MAEVSMPQPGEVRAVTTIGEGVFGAVDRSFVSWGGRLYILEDLIEADGDKDPGAEPDLQLQNAQLAHENAILRDTISDLQIRGKAMDSVIHLVAHSSVVDWSPELFDQIYGKLKGPPS